MELKVTVDFKQVADALSDRARRQVPFVAAKTISAVTLALQGRIKSRLPQVFDRPTLYTQRGVFAKLANKANLTGEVYFPDSESNFGKSAREYIRPGAEGASARSQKKTEYLLSRMGYLPSGWVTTPGTYIANGRLDSYGNMSGAYYKQIIRALGIKNTKGPAKPPSIASRKRAQRMGVDSEFFAVTPGANKLGKNGGWLPGGVYKRTGPGGRHLVQYLKFVRKASYKQRLNLKAEAMSVLNELAQQKFDEAVRLVVEKFKPN